MDVINMNEKNIENRLIEIETAIANMDKTIIELNDTVFEQWNEIDRLKKENKYLIEKLKSSGDSNIKSQSEETPPPHY